MSALHIDPVSGDLIPPTTQGSDPEPLWWNEEAGCYVRPWWAVLRDASLPMEGDSDEEDCEGCDGDDLHADDRCDECGRLLRPWNPSTVCADCRRAEDEELDDDEEYD